MMSANKLLNFSVFRKDFDDIKTIRKKFVTKYNYIKKFVKQYVKKLVEATVKIVHYPMKSIIKHQIYLLSLSEYQLRKLMQIKMR